ncbi:hypothetical protein PICMEDRAFT_98247 [Pichia membranifaciens NRRL Y-2026]|uniref:Protein STB3 n=1 Tax=Pichia membranifaciens NRRL Y-2026 TaxID=763406 RepID=A0A1E3NT51_9ASCO|nr:hypothetical protein PICMEDRAFT_98247 [Pichia membranifaciens NRRL Y-2026]ODQ49252.1 hypothetical protein PICMEDRAFT_98247 [Pichia membranifaciens NRRL Y-2026]
MYASSVDTPGSNGSGVAEGTPSGIAHHGVFAGSHVGSNSNNNSTATSRGTTPQIHNLLNLTSSDSTTERNNLSSMSLPLSSNSYSAASPSPPHNDTNTVNSLSPPPQTESNDAFAAAAAAKAKQKRKPTRKLSSNEEKVLLSTSSPEGIAAASQITPNRIANILIKEGPLPIRHLTGYLIQQVPAFGNLSLSKQRRLIMAALESGDILTGCVFEKIGWGQWEAKIVGKELVKIKIENSLNNNNNSSGTNTNGNSNISTPSFANGKDSGHNGVNNVSSGNATSGSTAIKNLDINNNAPPSTQNMDIDRQSLYSSSEHAHISQQQPGFYHTSIKSESAIADPKLKPSKLLSDSIRRESITSQSNDGTFKVPTSPTLGPIQNLRNSFKNYADIDEAIESSSDDEFENDYDDEDFNLNNDSGGSPPAIMESLHNGTSTGTSNIAIPTTATTNNSANNNKGLPNTLPKNKVQSIRSPSVSSSRRPSFAGILKPRKPRSSFNQHTLEVALDEGPLERRESRVSFSNSASLSRQSFLRTNISPRLSNNNSSASIHDKDNENAIADDDEEEDGNFTDEEDWQAIGPSSLRKNRHLSIVTPPTPTLLDSAAGISDNKPDSSKTDEEMAAIALMDLKTV